MKVTIAVAVVFIALCIAAFADAFRSIHFAEGVPSDTASSPVCPDGICPGLGNGFALWKVDALSVLKGGAIFFKNRSLGSCAKVTENITQSTREFSTSNSMEQFTKYVMTESGLSGSLSMAAFSASATAETVTKLSASLTTTFHAVQMDIQATNHSIHFHENSECFSKDNIDTQFLLEFNALPIITEPAEPAAWSSYVNFMSHYGSHIMIQQLIGSRFQLWESSTSTDSSIAQTLQIKACADVEGTSGGVGWSVEACSAYTKEQKETALKTQTNLFRVISGGTSQTRAALTAKVDQANLDNFIKSASQGDQPIRFVFAPVWELLQSIYSVDCATSGGAGSPGCNSVQRAVTLQAAYEGWLSTPGGCRTLKDNRNSIYQSMTFAGKPDSHGINIFGCHLSKTGCRSDGDCHLGGAGGTCYCYGKGCIDSGDKIPLLNHQQRDKVRGDESGSYDKGVNKSCYYKFIAHCNCDKGWAGGLPDRYIYLQSATQPSFESVAAHSEL